MATVKFKEGKKNETSFDVSGDEEVVFVVPDKNRMMRFIPLGCFKGNKNYQAGFIITSKRVIVVPLAPNKKNYEVQSFYFKDISGAKMVKRAEASQEANSASFSINMKPGQTSSCAEGGEFWVCMEMTVKNWLKVASAAHAESVAKAHASGVYSGLQMMDYQDYTAKSVDKYWNTMSKRAQDRAKNLDFSNAGHAQIRDFIVDMINDCVDEANKG